MASSSAKQKAHINPLIPEKFLDVPSQRLYYLSLGLLCQSIKLFDFLWSFASDEARTAACRKWLLVDFAYCVVLSQLRIPRLQYSRSTVFLQVLLLWFIDGVIFGGISLNFSALLGGSIVSTSAGYPDNPTSFGLRDLLTTLTFGLIASSGVSRDPHLQGQHTVRMSPISTAHLNPQNLNFCLSSTGFVLIPIILNNTNIAGLKYSLTPLGYPEHNSNIEMHNLSGKDFKAMQETYREKLQLAVQATKPSKEEDYDEYDDEDSQTQEVRQNLQRTQSLVHIMVNRPGIFRLERVYDSSNVDARLVVSRAVVVPCPRVQFAKDGGTIQDPIRCIGQSTDPQLKINVHGVPPLSLKWLRVVNGNREQFLVEGIEKEHKDPALDQHALGSHPTDHASAVSASSSVPTPEGVIVPLSVSLHKPGTYLYALEEVTDGVGNTIRVETDPVSSESVSASATATTRSFIVLQKPAVSFAQCSSDMPMSLLIGSEAKINLDLTYLDKFDKPWDLQLQYQPPADDKGGNKRLKAWKKTLKYDGEHKDLSLHTKAPGDYKIIGFKGKYCTGTILAPDTCKLVEKPFPSADIEWKRIHECAGDTGVSASLILHGTPPFQVYYRMQRDKGEPREVSKTFISSRAELTLQPERSGHYVFSFIAISDANYRKIELQGPSIDQMIHPVASADFSDSHGTGRGKKIVSTCSGDTVDIDVNLRGTGPWNLELQVIGPQQAETLQIQGIETSKRTIQILIPKELQKNGGSFEVALVSVEDASKCKRPVSVPGVEVKVKRIVPTVQFYGSKEERHITVTENQKTSLPLRLTGDGPWRIKYKRQDSIRIHTATLYDRNSELQVTDKGTYEILAVIDSQCPGNVVADASTYIVDWISRPSARLSASTDATYEPHNGSYILPPICEGIHGHVDLELTGRPPFQIMYNIAQDNDNGGTKIMGQPTFNSIQTRTRFQLHTSTPGRMYYEVKQVGDASYPLTENKDTIIPRSERLLFEQQVSIRPSAHFKSRSRLQYCLNDALVPLDSSSHDGLIVLEGSPPFTLVLSIKNIATSQVYKRTIQVPTNTWRLDLPSYSFASIGPHLVSIETVTDSSSCEQAALDPLHRSIWADVAETAAIIPIEKREDICAGDLTQFQLEGIPPWTITYKINSKSYTQEAKTSPFSLLQQQSGHFIVTSVAHQQKMCKAAVTDLRYNVHALPSAQVGHGKRIFQDIHEGDQAEIVFTLIGEPPFTITYQRAELLNKKAPKVLETHTVSRIQSHEYSIFSALEGTWTVTSISDRFCRYPPVQPDLAVEKHK